MNFVSIEEAMTAILARVKTLESETISLEEALGRSLAKPVVSPMDAPPFDNSAMDGIAFCFDDPTPLKVQQTIAAGDAPIDGAPGEAYRIMTGAAVPASCDTVVMREHAVEENGSVRFDPAPSRGDHIRKRGTYVVAGEEVLSVGTKIDAGVISLLATFGMTDVAVFRKPRVAILTTGDELIAIGDALQPGKIRNSNAWMLEAICLSAGLEPIRSPIIADDPVAVRDAFVHAKKTADVVVSVGGVSVGDFDFVRPTIEALCDDVSFWKVLMKPGKPLTHGVSDGVQLLGLPGNPMSCFVSFQVFGLPLLAALTGGTRVWKTIRVPAAQSMKSTPKRSEFVTGKIADGAFVRIGDQSSGNMAAMASCDALALIPIGESNVGEGELVEVLLLPV